MKDLREGFTTGTAAAGAALAALILLVERRAPENVSVPLPPYQFPSSCSGFASVPVEYCRPLVRGGGKSFASFGAEAAVRKDGGDDPDVTSGALISARVTLEPLRQDSPSDRGFVRLEGGRGVGRVTLPGLPVPVGEAAINPVPREQMRVVLSRYVGRAAPRFGPCPPLSVVISVPGGEKLALRTLNPRLGIVGGISILGTQGTVRPFSHAAWQATVSQGLKIALASGCSTVCLSTGRRSEALLMRRYPRLSPQSFIQAADFAAFSLRAAGSMPFANIVWGCFFGKLLKLAQGMEYTHAREGDIDFEALALLCSRSGVRCADAVRRCSTAAQALEILLADRAGRPALKRVARAAAGQAARFAGRAVTLNLFHADGGFLCAA
ncbi:MAG: cobalt-precorrin-5B (C(1))-methyltransferase CbiD [Desulfovibrio sp.]|jgi:cobalt-precorrin-5B (C1)-methyltransferase|nr:cobalt-precorrin-5B (C(1))-methyltransferase CbiD [Desulfovibrio sp.]